MEGVVLVNRRKSREFALQAIYMCDALGCWSLDKVKFTLNNFNPNSEFSDYTEKLCSGILENLPKLDSRISLASDNWSINRMGRVDKSILRIATYEMVFLTDIPYGVAINEAIEIAKLYSTSDSHTFINGVLDKIHISLLAENKDSSDSKKKKMENELFSAPKTEIVLV